MILSNIYDLDSTWTLNEIPYPSKKSIKYKRILTLKRHNVAISPKHSDLTSRIDYKNKNLKSI